MAPNVTQGKKTNHRRNFVVLGVLSVVLFIGLLYLDWDKSPPEMESYLTNPQKYEGTIYGPVPTGAPDDPFDITTIEGDGWRIYDSGPGLRGGGEAPFYWIGEKQVFFRGLNSPQFRSQDDEEKNKNKMNSWFYLWDLEKGIRRLDHLPVAYRYCSSEGIIYVGDVWMGAPKGIKKLLKVQDGEVKEDAALAEKLDSSIPNKHSRWNEFRCDWNIPEEGKYAHLSMTGLRRGDGRLFFKLDSSRQDRHPVRLFNPAKGIDLELPFLNYDVTTLCTRYFEFKGAYFLFDCLARTVPSGEKVAKWKQDNCLPAWWMWPDGRTEKVCIPYGPWAVRNTWHVIPTARGMFLSTLNFKNDYDAGDAGGYLYRNGKLKKIITGMLRIPGQFQQWVSPDGCRVAFGFAPTKSAESRVGFGRRTTRILDVCVDEVE